MKLNAKAGENISSDMRAEDGRSKTSLRTQYMNEKARIKSEIGDLESIRIQLGLSQRRLCRLLLVDPSAWTRWLKSEAPPHIYQALHWLIQLRKLNPDAVAPSDMDQRLNLVQSTTQFKLQELEQSVARIEKTMELISRLLPNDSILESDHIVSPQSTPRPTKIKSKIKAKIKSKTKLKSKLKPRAKVNLKSKRKRNYKRRASTKIRVQKLFSKRRSRLKMRTKK